MGAPGFDDAPVVRIARATGARTVTFVIPYYENPNFLARQLVGWSRYHPALRNVLSVIVVDDGSPEHPAETALPVGAWHDLDIHSARLFRIDADVRWNWLAARNIGAHHAADGWIMFTDMDHVVTEAVFETLVYGAHDPRIIYRFSRVEHTGEVIHPHPNSFFMTRTMFWRIGGYDERMSGYYGSDGYYRRRCAATAPIRIMADALVRHEYVGDSSTTHYLRKQVMDAELRRIVRAFPKGSKPKALSFPYHEVAL